MNGWIAVTDTEWLAGKANLPINAGVKVCRAFLIPLRILHPLFP
jgi:hypothetical protein